MFLFGCIIMNCIVLPDDLNIYYKEINIQIDIILAIFNCGLEPCGDILLSS